MTSRRPSGYLVTERIDQSMNKQITDRPTQLQYERPHFHSSKMQHR